MKTEQEMRDHEVPWLKTMDELAKYIQSLVDMKHDYGTSAYAMSLAGVAAFNFIGSKLGTTGFQASCADLDMIKRTRCIKGPFKIVKFSNMLYPQYKHEFFYQTISKDVWKWLQEAAKKEMIKADKEYEEYIMKHRQYLMDIDAFVKKYPDYYERKDYYDPLGSGTGDQWQAEEKKEESGFIFAPQSPYKPIDSENSLYKHWKRISNGIIPFNCKIKD